LGSDISKPKLSIVLINTEVPVKNQTRLAYEVVSLLPPGCSVGILAGAPLQQAATGELEAEMLKAVLLGGMTEANSGLPVVKGDSQVQDGLVAALSHFLHASQIPTCCLLVAGESMYCCCVAPILHPCA
jgi:hypothetical protein